MTNAVLEEKEQATQLETETDSTSSSEDSEEKVKDTEETKEVSGDDSLDDFLKTQGLADEAEVSASDEKKPEPADSKTIDVQAEAERLADQRIRAERERDAEERQRAGVRQSFETRADRIRGWGYGKVSAGEPITAQEVEALVQEFVQHNGQVSPVAKEDARKEFVDYVFREAEKAVGIKADGIKDTPHLIDAIVKKAREGYVSEKDVKPRIKKALLDWKADLEKKGIMKSKAVPGEGLSPVESRKADDILDDPNASAEARQKAFERKYGFKP